jgi:hypothetical protein
VRLGSTSLDLLERPKGDLVADCPADVFFDGQLVCAVPLALNEIGKRSPSSVPRTLTRPRVPQNATNEAYAAACNSACTASGCADSHTR